MATLCPLAMHVFKRGVTGPCPALEWDGPESRCGLVANPQNYGLRRVLAAGRESLTAAARLLIGATTGCDARINGEPANSNFYAELTAWDRKHAREVRDAKRLWGMR